MKPRAKVKDGRMSYVETFSKHAYHRYDGFANILIVPDHMAGHRHRYTVMMLTANDPIIIGRELSLSYSKELIREYADISKSFRWKYDTNIGDAKELKSFVRFAQKIRKNYEERICE